MNATLREYSLVYEGATPGAGVVKASRMIEEGLIDEHGRVAGIDLPRLERVYGQRFALPTRTHAIGGIKEDRAMTVEQDTKDESVETFRAEYEALQRELLDTARTVGIRASNPGAALSEIESLVEGLRGDIDDREATIKDLEPMATDGRAYRDHLIDMTIKAAARATVPSQREVFNEERLKRQLERMDVEDIRAQYEREVAIGDELLGSGRISQEEDDGDWTPPKDLFRVPVGAYSDQ